MILFKKNYILCLSAPIFINISQCACIPAYQFIFTKFRTPNLLCCAKSRGDLLCISHCAYVPAPFPHSENPLLRCAWLWRTPICICQNQNLCACQGAPITKSTVPILWRCAGSWGAQFTICISVFVFVYFCMLTPLCLHAFQHAPKI